jgi:hypothetical protein
MKHYTTSKNMKEFPGIIRTKAKEEQCATFEPEGWDWTSSGA